ncbi:MAG: hypothetical protein ABIF19_01330 [Planctomycetota bacterium]
MTLRPCYDFPKPNENSVLARRKASVIVRGACHELDAVVRLRLLPSPGIEIEGALPQSSGIVEFDNIGNFAIKGRDIPGFPIRVPLLWPGDGRFVWALKHEPTLARGTAETEMLCVVFHIFNYNDFHGTRRSIEEGATGRNAICHVDLKASGWNVEIKSLSTTADTVKTLRASGGYGLTHIGSLQKEDGSFFDGKTAEQTLNALRHFFSFSRGMWCVPCLAVGFDNSKSRVWEAWSSPGGRWASPTSWFDPHHCDQLVKFFPGFMANWKDANWRKALHEVIYWYLSSNSSTLGLGINIDGGIILTQAAIERLSFEYVVRERRLIETEGFKNLRASDKIRLLLSSLDIPIDIPASLPEFRKLAGQFGWLDGPHAITEVRNSLVHPDHKRIGQFGKAFFPAWSLGQWYLELALLRICAYSGTYSNRLVLNKYVGTVEPVPWNETKAN